MKKILVVGDSCKDVFVYGDISRLSPQARVKEGISFVPQSRNVFTGLSVQENLEMGAFINQNNINDFINEIYNHSKKFKGIVIGSSGLSDKSIKILENEFIIPPFTIVGSKPASLKMFPTKLVVVVFPWDPAMAIDFLFFIDISFDQSFDKYCLF